MEEARWGRADQVPVHFSFGICEVLPSFTKFATWVFSLDHFQMRFPQLRGSRCVFFGFKPQMPNFEETAELLLLSELRRQLFGLKRAVEVDFFFFFRNKLVGVVGKTCFFLGGSIQFNSPACFFPDVENRHL